MTGRTDFLIKRYGPHLREARGVCPAIIAYVLGLNERTVMMLQRKMGLRKLTVNGGPNRNPLGRSR